VLANPPFNVDDVPIGTVEKDARFNTYGIPRNKGKVSKADIGKETVPNGNYLWISLFATSLKPKGRAALVMANSASDARHSEADIRRNLIEQNLIAGMLTLPSNMFYTVTLPATLWFFDKAKPDSKILFIDARNIFTQIDRAHREFSEEQVQNIAVISRLHKGRRGEFLALIDRYFASGMERLAENRQQVEPVSAQLLSVLEDPGGHGRGRRSGEGVGRTRHAATSLRCLSAAQRRPGHDRRQERRPTGAARHLRAFLYRPARLSQTARPRRSPPGEASCRSGEGRWQARWPRPTDQGAEDRT
jgi:type I restriction enzyme M protein